MGGGGAPLGKYGKYLGWWGNLGSPKQKGIVTYSISPNRQNPLAGTLDAAIFNVFRRSKNQVLYVVPPFIAAYYAMQWAIERNEFLNSKTGRALYGEEEG